MILDKNTRRERFKVAKMFAKLFTSVKYMLVSVNILFLITGVIILAVGSSVQVAYNNYHEFLVARFFSLPAFCIATGVIILLISFIGFYGAFMENYYMNMAFAVAMIIIFIFQVSGCIAGYVLRGNTIPVVQKELLSTMQLYGPNQNYEVTKLWDEVQKDFTCCGVINSSDWVNALHTEEFGVPMSCCDIVYGTVNTFTCNVTVAYSTGCGEAFGNWVSGHAAAIAFTGIALVLMQAFAVAGALWMAKISRSENLYS